MSEESMNNLLERVKKSLSEPAITALKHQSHRAIIKQSFIVLYKTTDDYMGNALDPLWLLGILNPPLATSMDKGWTQEWQVVYSFTMFGYALMGVL